MDDTGAARGTVAGGSNAAPSPPPPPALISYPLDTLGRIRTRGDMAALINAGSDSITIKSEICGEGYEPMEEDESNDVICVVNLDERNRIISLDDPFGTEDDFAEEEGNDGTEGEELLEESEGSGEEGDDEGEDGADHPLVEEEGGPRQEGDVESHQPGLDPVAGIAADANVKTGVKPIEGEQPAISEEETGENPQEIRADPVSAVKHPDNLYRVVRSVMAGGQDPLKLNPCMKYYRGEDPGFMAPGDERILRNANMCNMEEKRISSVSFDPVSGRCYTCLNGEHRAWMARDGGPICVVLSDQHFPANIPADSAGECMWILRIENGSLREWESH